MFIIFGYDDFDVGFVVFCAQGELFCPRAYSWEDGISVDEEG